MIGLPALLRQFVRVYWLVPLALFDLSYASLCSSLVATLLGLGSQHINAWKVLFSEKLDGNTFIHVGCD